MDTQLTDSKTITGPEGSIFLPDDPNEREDRIMNLMNRFLLMNTDPEEILSLINQQSPECLETVYSRLKFCLLQSRIINKFDSDIEEADLEAALNKMTEHYDAITRAEESLRLRKQTIGRVALVEAATSD